MVRSPLSRPDCQDADCPTATPNSQTARTTEAISSPIPGLSPSTQMDEDLDDYLLNYEPSPARDDMDVNVIYLSSTDYSLLGEEKVS